MDGMKIKRWKFHVRAGYQQLERQRAIGSFMIDAGERIAAAAGGESGDYLVSARVYPGGYHVIVATATEAARKAEAESRALSRAIDAGR